MTEPEPPAPRPASQLSSPPQQPAIADALRALGPDYEEALVNSIAERVDELARQREARARAVASPDQAHHVAFPGAPAPLPIPAPPTPAAPVPTQEPQPHRQRSHSPGNPGLPVSILSLIFGFVATVVALTAGLAISGPVALVAILIVWIAIVLINVAVW
ncbi:MAG: hypothetical protein J2P44_02685, partial [Candidatus Dormibacteraeota bacterium]|nr:hypothetical protein [Candidatus Dormibacteraeota bacterium]